MRESDDMFSSLISYVTYERARVISLTEEVEKVKQKAGAKLGEAWPSGCTVPLVEEGNQKLRLAASTLPTPTPIGQQSLDLASEFMVESASGGALRGSSAGGTGFKWRVKLNAIQARRVVAGVTGMGTPNTNTHHLVCFRKRTSKQRVSVVAMPPQN